MLRSSEPKEGQSELVRIRAAIEASGDILYDWDLATDRLLLLGATDAVFGRDAAELQPYSSTVRLEAVAKSLASITIWCSATQPILPSENMTVCS